MSRVRRIIRWSLFSLAGLVLLGAMGAAALYFAVSSKLPDVQSLRDVELQEPLYVYSNDGKLMALFGEMRRYPVKIEDVPERLKQSFMAIEDARFYEHEGVDYKGVARAIWLLATTSDRRVPGGSTITQQVARQFFLSSEYSFTRKFAEMLLAMKMERELSKDEIFELYLNKSFFGNRAYGIAAAAEFYYGKTLDQLDLDEMVSLASIPKFPSSGNPISNPERAKERRNYGLDRMVELGYVSAAEAAAAKNVAMHARPHERPIEVYSPYVAEMVRQEMIERYGDEALIRGYHVTTTIDTELQAAAQQAVYDGLMLYDRRHGWHGVEQNLELAEGDSADTAIAKLREIPAQAGLLPAAVLSASGNSAEAVLANGERVSLNAASTRWTNRSPGALLKRGDVVRLIRQQADDGAVTWRVSQVPRAQAALVSLDSDTGAVRALIGGFSFAGNMFNRATQARRQPGSSFKPFVYAASFERGYNPASIVLDAPVVFTDRRGRSWRPQNDGGGFSGPMRLREALVRSKNLVSVRLLDAIGVDYARRYISHFGVDEELIPPNLSMSLGTASIPPMMVARGYAAFSNGGFRIEPWFIQEVKDRNGQAIYTANPATACKGCGIGNRPASGASAQPQSNVVDGFNFGAEDETPAKPEAKQAAEPAEPRASLPEGRVQAPRAIDERVAYQMVSMMRDVVTRGTATAARVLNREDVGGKTGSTNDYRDAWFAGFGGPYTTVVWVGRDDFRSLGRGEYGGRAALPIWIDYMRAALKDKPVAENEPPDGMVRVAVSAGGRLMPTNSGGGLTEWVKAEDLERMDTYTDYGDSSGSGSSASSAPQHEAPPEESFEIF